MSDDDRSDEREEARREILSAVARGDMTPTEAADRLHELDNPPPEADQRERRYEPPPGPSRSTYEPPPGNPAQRIRVEAGLRGVEIVGDSSVNEAVVEGPHEARRDGDTLVIETTTDDDFRSTAFSFASVGRHGMRIKTRAGRPPGIGRNPGLFVRMNTNLPLDSWVEAGALTTRGVKGPIRAHVAAGSARIDGFDAPIDVEVAAGGLKARGRLDHGESRIRCDAGSVKIHLDRGSSVRVNGESHLGKVSMDNDVGSRGLLNDSRTMTIGNGEGTLDIEVSLGSVKLTSDD